MFVLSHSLLVTVMILTPFSVLAADEPIDDPTLKNRKRSEWIAQLKDNDVNKRIEAATMIGSMGRFGQPARKELIVLLARDESPKVRAEVVEALGKLGDPDFTVPVLITALKDTDGSVRVAAARALGMFGPEAKAAIDTLVARLKSDDPYEAASAGRTLAQIDSKRKDGIQTLIRIAQECKDEEGRDYALSLLVVETDDAVLKQHADLVIPALITILKENKPPIGEDTTWSRRLSAIYGLGTLGSSAKSTLPTLTPFLNDRHPNVRVKTAHAMLRIDPKNGDALRALALALKEKDPLHLDGFNRMEPASIAGELGPVAKPLVPELIALLQEPKIHVQVPQAVVSSLGRIGPDAKAALPVLTERLKSADSTERWQAAEAVVAIDPKNADAIKILKGFALTPDKDVWIDSRMGAVATLALIPSEKEATIRILTAAVRNPEQFEKREGLAIGGKIVIDREDLLIAVKNRSLQILGRAGADAKEAIPYLVEALKDSRLEVRMTAAEALRKIDPQAAEKAGLR